MNQPAKISGNLPYDLAHPLPGNDNIGPLKDMAQEITAASAGQGGKITQGCIYALRFTKRQSC